MTRVTCANCGTESASAAVAFCVDCGHGLGDGDPNLAPGTVLGSYRVLDLLGEGGMGQVYLAEHVKLGRRVAIKMLRPKYTANPVAVARFFAEARAVNRISHENIVEITDFVENAGGRNYYIMELLKGEDLAHVLMSVGVLPIPRALDIASQVVSVLGAVHAAKIVHRDLKPDNIFLVERPNRPDFVKLLDFGVAKLGDPDGNAIQVGTTAAGTIVGTPEYMSPEQASGQGVDWRTDIYALGVILYEMITGTVPFRARFFGEMVVKHLTIEPRPPSTLALPHAIPPALEELVLGLLRKNPDDRPQSMAAIAQRLRDISEELAEPPEPRITPRAITQRPEPRARSSPSHERAAFAATESFESLTPLPAPPRRRRLRLAFGAAALLAVGCAAWLALHARTEPAAAATTRPAEPSPEPAPPREVVIEVRSTPPGATVRVADSGEVLGATPLTRHFARADGSVTVELEAAGFAKGTQTIALSRDATIAVALAPLPPVPSAGKPAATTPPHVTTKAPARVRSRTDRNVDRGGTMNVFDE